MSFTGVKASHAEISKSLVNAGGECRLTCNSAKRQSAKQGNLRGWIFKEMEITLQGGLRGGIDHRCHMKSTSRHVPQ